MSGGKDKNQRDKSKKSKNSAFSAQFKRWLAGDDLLAELEEEAAPQAPAEDTLSDAAIDGFSGLAPVRRVQKRQIKSFSVFYAISAAVCCLILTAVLLVTVAKLPEYGELSANAAPLDEEYLTKSVEETGAVNVVAAVILSYRAFDTLGESFVLFTALCCVTVLLRVDSKVKKEELLYYDLSGDLILRRTVSFIAPVCILFGVYVMFNGHLSPGGGFSGGAIAGAGLILLSAAFGFGRLDRVLTARLFNGVCGGALGFYLISKTFTFVVESAGLDTHVPKGTPGTLFSGGLILPLNLAVGLTVAMTIFGIYCLFRRGHIGAPDGAKKIKTKKEGGKDA